MWGLPPSTQPLFLFPKNLKMAVVMRRVVMTLEEDNGDEDGDYDNGGENDFTNE